MTENDPPDPIAELPEAQVGKKRRVGLVWLIPMAALFVAGFLLWQHWESRGPTIYLTFENASGIKPDKTTLRFRDVVVGTVDAVNVSDDLSTVKVTATLARNGDAFRVQGTRFWVKKARLGVGGISGLGTLVSGDYIGIDPGPPGGPHESHFKGLEHPPVNLTSEKGLRLTVRVDHTGPGLNNGSPVIHEGIHVGSISNLELDPQGHGVLAHVFIQKKYSDRVFSKTRFWNASGLEFQAGLTGVEVELDSMATLLSGGIGFGTPEPPNQRGKRAQSGAVFSLYKSRKEAFRAYSESLGLHIILSSSSLARIREGNPILYKGETIGAIRGRYLHQDSKAVGIRAQIFPRFTSLVRDNSVFWDSSGLSASLGLTGIHIHLESIESFISGAISVATPDEPGLLAKDQQIFKLHEKAKDKWLDWSPEINLPDDAEVDHVYR